MSARSSQFLGYCYILITVVIWSTTEVITRLIIHEITPVQLSAARFLIGGTFLMLFLPKELKRRGLKLTGGILMHGTWLGAIGITLANLCFNVSLQSVGAGIVATVYSSVPLAVFFLAAIFLREPLSRGRFLGVILGVCGIAVLASSKASSIYTFNGFLIACGGTFAFSTYTVFLKKFAGPYHGLPIAALSTMAGGIILLMLALIEGKMAQAPTDMKVLLPILYLGVGPGGLCYLTLALAIRHIDATQAMSMLFLKPPIAVLLAAVVLGEPLTWNLAGAMVFIAGGLYLVMELSTGRIRRWRKKSSKR